MSLYTLDGNTRQLLRLTNFGTPDFSVKSFIEQLSGSQRHLDEDQRLDPKPYIRTFESAAAELERLHEIALGQEEAAASAAAELTESRNLEMQDIAANVKECVNEVKALDEVATEIQHLSGPVGQNLERISFQHQQLCSYRLLTSAYLSFAAGRQPAELSRLWSQDMRQCANCVAQLQQLATSIGEIDGSKEAQVHIDKYAENLENQLLSNFLDSYQNFDLPGMRGSADVLTEFNGGGAVVQAYINQHRFFMNVEQQQLNDDEQENSEFIWAQLRDYRSTPSGFIAKVDQTINEITETIARETEIITKVFPRPAQVLSLFIQRTFAQKIQEIIYNYMDEAIQSHSGNTSGTLAQVRVLSICYSRVNTMVNDLQKIWSSSHSNFSEAEQSQLATVMESNFNDAFVLYLDEYFEQEQKSLVEIINSEFKSVGSNTSRDHKINGGNNSQSNSASGNNSGVAEDGRIDRLRRAMRNLRHDDSDDDNSSDPSSGLTVSNAANGGNPTHDNEAGNSSRDPQYKRWSRLQAIPYASVHNVLAAFGEAISREQILRPSSSFAPDATALYNLLSTELGGRYISAAIDAAIAVCAKIDPKFPIDWSFIESIQTSGHALRLVAAFVKTVLFAMVQFSPQTQQNIADALNIYILNVQRSCLNLIEQVIDQMHIRTKTVFAKNSRRDFLDPSGDSIISPELLNDFRMLAQVAKAKLSQENCQRLLKVVALNFCDDLLDHIQQFSISVQGGMVLTSDLADYERLMNSDWGTGAEVAEKLTTLTAIFKLYTADHSIIPSLLRDSHIAKIPKNQRGALLSLRSDNNNNKLTNMLYFGGDFRPTSVRLLNE